MDNILKKCVETANKKFSENGMNYRHDTCIEHEGVYMLMSSQYPKDGFEIGGYGLPEVFDKSTGKYLGNISSCILSADAVNEGRFIRQFNIEGKNQHFNFDDAKDAAERYNCIPYDKCDIYEDAYHFYITDKSDLDEDGDFDIVVYKTGDLIRPDLYKKTGLVETIDLNNTNHVEIVYSEPVDFFPKEIRKKCKLGEFAEDDEKE